MRGKTVIVTGAGSGIGFETAAALARQGAAVVLIELDRSRGEAAVARMQGVEAAPRLLVADLSRQSDIESVARELLASGSRIHVLINNAGATFDIRALTADGLERTFALNHMGYFCLTGLLLDRMIEGAPARVISVSSGAHRGVQLELEDLQAEKSYSGYQAYQRTKLANILFTRVLANRLRGTHVTANCLEPSPRAVMTRFFENVNWARNMQELHGPITGDTPTQGARTPVFLASSPDVSGITGQYFAECRVAVPSDEALNDVTAEQLWAASLRLCSLSRLFSRVFASGSGL